MVLRSIDNLVVADSSVKRWSDEHSAQRQSFYQHLLLTEYARFFFADERTKDGGPMGKTPDGESHAKVYLSLVEGKEDLPHYVTFVEGKYRKFD